MQTANRHHANRPSVMSASDRAKMRAPLAQAKRARFNVAHLFIAAGSVLPLFFLGSV
jgi:hypothetical protein